MSRQVWGGSVERIRRCLTARGRRQQGLYTFEGERLLKRALSAGVALEEIVLGEDLALRGDLEPSRIGSLVREATERGTSLSVAPVDVLQQLAEGRNSGQLVMLARLPEPSSLDQILAQHASDLAPLLVAVDIDEPGNVGALVRTALCSGVSLFVAFGATDPFHPKAVRTSMGAIFKLPWMGSVDHAELSARLARARIERVATVTADGTPVGRARLGGGRLALYVGNEARGLPTDLGEQADERVTVVMPPGVDSFSVNAATAIVLYEANLRRVSGC